MPLIDITFDPDIARLGPFILGWHGIFSMLALLFAVWFGLWRMERLGLPVDTVISGLSWVIVGAVVGARLFHVMDHLPYYLANPLEIPAVWQGGIAVYGGFIGGVVVGVIAAWKLAVPIWPALDAAALAMLLGQAIGRIGCFINGDAWGAPTGGNWGVVYWNEHALVPPELLGVPTQPYPLYEIAAVMLVFGLLWFARDRLRRPGTLFLLATIGYAVIRFGLTYFRQETVIVFGLQEAQVIALVTGGIAFVFLAVRSLRGTAVAVPATQ
ncbi:MAG: prolipoprotein diacylglyceryl transferase [Chloroflexi bacterium]|nr:prolipoprotein diacylglyceryl transferase [Chloroflexota bacterium]